MLTKGGDKLSKQKLPERDPLDVIAEEVASLGEEVLRDPRKFGPEVDQRLARIGWTPEVLGFLKTKVRVLEYLAIYRKDKRSVA